MENRIEWNNPRVVSECRGVCPSCRVDDNVNVFFWDQPHVKNIRHVDNCCARCEVRWCYCIDGDIIVMHDNHCIPACRANKVLAGSPFPVPQTVFYLMVQKGQGEAAAALMTQMKLEALNRMGLKH